MGNSTKRIFGLTPAFWNWPRRAEPVVLTLRGEQPTTTEWCAGVVAVAGYELDEST